MVCPLSQRRKASPPPLPPPKPSKAVQPARALSLSLSHHRQTLVDRHLSRSNGQGAPRSDLPRHRQRLLLGPPGGDEPVRHPEPVGLGGAQSSGGEDELLGFRRTFVSSWRFFFRLRTLFFPVFGHFLVWRETKSSANFLHSKRQHSCLHVYAQPAKKDRSAVVGKVTGPHTAVCTVRAAERGKLYL